MAEDTLIKPEYAGPTIKWDDVTITHEAANLPPDLREDYVWFKTWGRESCLSDMEIITDRMRQLGIVRDKTTWSRVLRGRLNRNSRGEAVAPHVSYDNLKQEITAARENCRVELLRGLVPFVQTRVWLDIEGEILKRAESTRVNKFLVIVGPTGSQKTACFKEFCRRHNHGRTKHVEAPENGLYTEFLTILSRACGLSSVNFGGAQMRQRIFQAFGLGSPAERARRILIVDNAQDIWQDDPKSKQPAFTFLRRLQDSTGCTVVLSITPIFERKLVEGMIAGWFEQIEGRSGGRRSWLRLPEFPTDEDVLAIAKSFGLTDARSHLKELRAISREPGRVRRLFEDLQEGKLEAGKDPFTYQHVRTARDEV